MGASEDVRTEMQHYCEFRVLPAAEQTARIGRRVCNHAPQRGSRLPAPPTGDQEWTEMTQTLVKQLHSFKWILINSSSGYLKVFQCVFLYFYFVILFTCVYLPMRDYSAVASLKCEIKIKRTKEVPGLRKSSSSEKLCLTYSGCH